MNKFLYALSNPWEQWMRRHLSYFSSSDNIFFSHGMKLEDDSSFVLPWKHDDQSSDFFYPRRIRGV